MALQIEIGIEIDIEARYEAGTKIWPAAGPQKKCH
jgi:hypothetical protein